MLEVMSAGNVYRIRPPPTSKCRDAVCGNYSSAVRQSVLDDTSSLNPRNLETDLELHARRLSPKRCTIHVPGGVSITVSFLSTLETTLCAIERCVEKGLLRQQQDVASVGWQAT
jgi:hypothetical protein